MGARKRASASTTTDATKLEPTTNGQCQTDPSIAPCKSGLILKLFLLLSMPCFYLIYKIESQLKKSILINTAVSLAGFFVTQKMIPVASTYVLRRNLFGFDINKKGTPQGTLKVPESLGIVVGIVFLVLAILFQYFNFTADSNWLVEYNAALASICFMILLGFVDDVLDVPWRVFDPQTGLLTGTNDGTLVNVFLRLFGKMSEKSLCARLLIFQAIGCCLCFVLRYFLSGWYK